MYHVVYHRRSGGLARDEIAAGRTSERRYGYARAEVIRFTLGELLIASGTAGGSVVNSLFAKARWHKSGQQRRQTVRLALLAAVRGPEAVAGLLRGFLDFFAALRMIPFAVDAGSSSSERLADVICLAATGP